MRRGQVTLQLGLQQVVTGRVELGREAPVSPDRGGQFPQHIGHPAAHVRIECGCSCAARPRLAFLPEPTRAEPNQIVLRIDPDPGLRLQLSALAGQSWRPVHLDTSFARELGEPPEPYEVLLHAAMVGDHQYFAREDSVEETWRIVQPLLDRPPDVRPYPRGSWGPEEAETLLRGHPRWQQPWLPGEG